MEPTVNTGTSVATPKKFAYPLSLNVRRADNGFVVEWYDETSMSTPGIGGSSHCMVFSSFDEVSIFFTTGFSLT